MGTELVRAEIERFLESAVPEVLCIKGKWGVGKTYAWMHFLREKAVHRKLGFKKYSYVSLFGLNSLDAMRYAIFEGKITESQIERGPNLDSLKDAIEGAIVLGRKAKPLLVPLLSRFGVGDTEDSLARATFFSVRNQLVCIDDLERAGEGLDLKDVLGLASMLKEQRHCKVVLLLNDEQLPDDKKEDFEKLLEKVADVSLVFDPTSREAVEIAFQTPTDVNRLLAEKIERIGVKNIRVIKKIERLADRLAELLGEYHVKVVQSAMQTVSLAGWSVFMPDSGPPIKFLKRFNRDVQALTPPPGEEEQHKKWTEVLTSLGYRFSDDLDAAIIDGVSTGYFDIDRLILAARKLQAEIENDSWDNSFTRAWDRYHGSLLEDDGEILDCLYASALENLRRISPASLNGTVMLLREFNRHEEASQLVHAYMAARQFKPGVIREEFLVWGEGPIDAELEAAFQKIDDDYVDTRDPKEVLCQIAEDQGWSNADIDLLAKQSAEDFERIFESIQGRMLSRAAKFVVGLSKHEGENFKAMGKAVEGGLKRIAAKSPLKAKRVASYGIELDEGP